MLTRSELKNRAKAVMQRSYWRCVLAALVLSIATLFATGGATSRAGRTFTQQEAANFEFGNHNGVQSFHIGPGGLDDFAEEFGDEFGDNDFEEVMDTVWPVLPFFIGIVLFIVIIASIVRILMSCFLFNPLEVGAQRFFVVNQAQPGEPNAEQIGFAFSHGYLNVVKTLFLRDLYTFLWTLLLIIPGIVKSYSYRLIPYIMAEEPEMDQREAFRLSMSMMEGHKWEAFVLDLSFILWKILGWLTAGILNVFYVNPYQAATNVEYYAMLRDNYLSQGQGPVVY